MWTLAPFPLQELSPGTRDLGRCAVCSHWRNQDLNKVPGKKCALQKVPAREVVGFFGGPELSGAGLGRWTCWLVEFLQHCISTTIYCIYIYIHRIFENVSNLHFIIKDIAYLKMCFADFGDVSSTRSAGAQCSRSHKSSITPSDICRWLWSLCSGLKQKI